MTERLSHITMSPAVHRWRWVNSGRVEATMSSSLRARPASMSIPMISLTWLPTWSDFSPFAGLVRTSA
jgi:hypothetical protein